MLNLTKEQVYRICDVVMQAGGASPGHAGIVADHLVNANLAGYDSHGLIRLSQYMTEIKEGLVDPKAEPEVVGNHGGVLQVDGHGTFGQVVAKQATKMAIEKARDYGISVVGMGNHTHTGRIGAYPEMAAEAGMAAIMLHGWIGGPFAKQVPFGGREARLGSNPLAMAFPQTEGASILLDISSTITSEGTLRIYRNKGQDLPDSWVMDKHGVPSRNPNDFFDGGASLPVGGMLGGHKGFGLALMAGLFGGLLGQISSAAVAHARWNGSTLFVIDIGQMAPQKNIQAEVQQIKKYIKDTPLMEGSSGVFLPGERSASMRQQRLAEGIPVDSVVWTQVEALFDQYGVRDELGGFLPAV
jgi:uncharacterized oxidoreductase